MCPTYESTLLLSSTVFMLWPTEPHIGHVIRSSDAKPPAPISGGFNSSNSDSISLRWADVDLISLSFSDMASDNSWIWVSLCNKVLFNSLNCEVNWVISFWEAEILEVRLLISSWFAEIVELALFNSGSKSVISCLAVSSSEVKFAIFSSDELSFESFSAMLFSRSLTLVLAPSSSVFRESFSVVKLVIVWSFSLISASVFSSVFWVSVRVPFVSSRVFFVSASSVSVLSSCSFVFFNSVEVSDNCFSRSLTLALRSNKILPATDVFLSGFDSIFSQSIILFHLWVIQILIILKLVYWIELIINISYWIKLLIFFDFSFKNMCEVSWFNYF